jgi:hypothetical protein
MALGHPLDLRRHLEDASSSPLYIAHDGGATERGSFGWLIASDLHIFWEGSGRTYGRNPGLFRAESYGMLAALRFLHHYVQFHAVSIALPDTEHLEYTDSKSLLNRLSSSMARFFPSPGACLKSEFDLEIAIRATITATPLTITRHHIAAHQDNKQPDIIKLRWKAQLNIVCDRLASRQLEVCPLETKVFPNPYCHAYVYVRGESITGQIRKSLFDAAAYPRMKAYLLERYSWDDTVFATIDWDSIHSSIRGLTGVEHRFTTKFCFKHLPVGTRLRQRQSLAPQNCPACNEPREDDWHWISCPSKEDWRTKQAPRFIEHPTGSEDYSLTSIPLPHRHWRLFLPRR